MISKTRLGTALAAAATTLLMASQALALGEPLNEVVTSDVRDCRASLDTTMPIIAWGADVTTIEANGGTMKASPGALTKAGWSLDLAVKDDFKGQVQDYLECKSPFLRGTLGMLTAAAPVTEADTRSQQVIIYKHSWSAGDAIVVGEGIRKASDLVGKRFAVQAFGPHIDFVARFLADAGLSLEDVTIVWVNDLTGTEASPAALMRRGEVDAAAMILPDARELTSGGNVGTGAEGSLRGSTILISTLEATTVVGDYISVRRDFFEANREAIAELVNALLRAEESTRIIMSQDGTPDQIRLGKIIADEMLGGMPAEEGVLLWRDAITDGWSGNARHFADPADPRRFAVLMDEVNGALMGAKMIARPYTLATAEWNWTELTDGLTDISARQIAAFNPEKASAAVQTLRQTGMIDDATKIDFLVYFEPDTPDFPAHLYADRFDQIIRLAATYSGAIVTVEGHSDPLHYLKREKAGADDTELKAIRTRVKNLSLNRAIAVVNALQSYADDKGILINPDQFTVDGLGISEPVFNPPMNPEEWRQNMRVKFRVLTVQAEATEFSPL